MRSFFAMLWSPADAHAEHAAERLKLSAMRVQQEPHKCVAVPGFFLIDLSPAADRPSIVRVRGRDNKVSGAVFGTIFRTENSPVRAVRLADFSEAASDRILRTEGLALHSDFWGCYVGFIAGETRSVLIADPTSSIPCYYTERHGVMLVFSHLERCPLLDIEPFEIDYQFISALLTYDRIQSGSTGLKGVKELLGGQRLIVSEMAEKVDQVWDPRLIASDAHEPTIDDAAAELRETTSLVVSAWGSQFSSIVVNLSGGFDSSSVLGFLAKSGGHQRIKAVHHVVDSSDVSEADYARAAAAYAEYEYVEVLSSPRRPLPDAGSHPPTVRPVRQFIGIDPSADLQKAGVEFADAALTGEGGDHLFIGSRNVLVFKDFLKRRGVRPQIASELVKASALSGKSIWAVMKECLPLSASESHGLGMVSAFNDRQRDAGLLLTQHLAAEECLPAWAREPLDLPPVKFRQVSHLLHMVMRRQQLEMSWTRNLVHPLVSQPLMELCLRIPSYIHCANAQPRGLARIAYKDILPDRIRLRMTKGGTSRYFIDYIATNRDRIVDALVDGELENAGLISRAGLMEMADQRRYQFTNGGRALLIFYGIEAWLRKWSEIKLQSPRHAGVA